MRHVGAARSPENRRLRGTGSKRGRQCRTAHGDNATGANKVRGPRQQACPIMRRYSASLPVRQWEILRRSHPGDARIQALPAGTAAFADSYDGMNFSSPFLKPLDRAQQGPRSSLRRTVARVPENGICVPGLMKPGFSAQPFSRTGRFSLTSPTASRTIEGPAPLRSEKSSSLAA